MRDKLFETLSTIINDILRREGVTDFTPNFTVVIPDDAAHGDYATNGAMQLARPLRKNPKAIAEEIALRAEAAFGGGIKAQVAGPGFINFTISKEVFHKTVMDIINDPKFFHNDYGKGRRVLVEFVSANPTGPLHIGHGRGAAYGDSLARVLAASGYEVKKEYYINDAGNQMNNLALSVYCRICQENGVDFEFPENGYKGDYIFDIAKDVMANYPDILQADRQEALKICLDEAVSAISKTIKDDLAGFRTEFDSWFSEKSLYTSGAVEKTLKTLSDKGETYEKDGALWLSTEKKGDDKDRVLKKSTGEYTYFAPDIAYHADKYARGFDYLIDVWGADHHGYIKRMTCAIEALGYKGESFEATLVQMVNLIKGGEKISMSTRSGSFIPLNWLIDEVGADAARFFYNMRSHDAQFDFDIDLAKATSSDNPVYYVQYAHARVYSLISNAQAKGHKYERGIGLERLTGESETGLIKEMLRLKYVTEKAAIHLEPHRIAYYLQELAGAFHSYYYANQIISSDTELTNARLTLCEAAAITIRHGLALLGVSAPERM
ncbi:MAG: arginine--tRNA ligase [Deferribacterales bacterium]|nr:arginine--tRNA ligase [Deferribacterales bacterium]